MAVSRRIFATMQPLSLSLDAECSFKTSRSGGAGGQHVNKVSTKVQLDFNVAQSAILSESQKELILRKLASRITKEGILQIVAQAERTQMGNKDAAIDLFYELINKALTPPKPRKATRPTKSSVQRRLTAKKRDSDIKGLRKKWEE
jgi:ribosome-associated protein